MIAQSGWALRNRLSKVWARGQAHGSTSCYIEAEASDWPDRKEERLDDQGLDRAIGAGLQGNA